MTLEVLTKMHYQDFNQAGDKNVVFNPAELITGNPNNNYMSDGGYPNMSSEEDNDEVDEFTK